MYLISHNNTITKDEYILCKNMEYLSPVLSLRKSFQGSLLPLRTCSNNYLAFTGHWKLGVQGVSESGSIDLKNIIEQIVSKDPLFSGMFLCLFICSVGAF